MTIKKEAIWVFSSTAVSSLTQLSILFILAQLGSPAVLGELAIINIILAIAFILQDLGLSSYFIHRQSLNKDEESTLYFINLTLGAIASLLVFFLSSPIGDFYQSETISYGLQVIALNFLIIGATAQYQANFIKSFRNDLLAKIEITSKLILLTSALFFIYYFDQPIFGYLYAILISNVVKFFLVLIASPRKWHPQLLLNTAIVKPSLSFGIYQMGSQVINQIRTQLDQIIIGKWLGIEALGIYSLAKELVMQPTKLIAPLTSKLILPRLAKVQDSLSRTKEIFNTSCNFILLLNLIIYVGLTLVLYFGIPLFFGESYKASFEIFSILLLVGLLRPMGTLFGALSQANGASKIEFKWNLISALVLFTSIGVALPFKTLTAFAFAMAGTQFVLSLYAAFYFSTYLKEIDKDKHIMRIMTLIFVYILIQVLLWYFN